MAAPSDTPVRWLARLHHDLVKRLLWPARDARDAGGWVRPGQLAPALIDDEGQPVGVAALWESLRASAPPEVPRAALEAFGATLARAARAAEGDDRDGVLALEPAFAELARIVKPAPGA